MSYHEKLNAEIDAKLDGLQAMRMPMVARWIAHTICTDHSGALIKGTDDADFWQHTGYAHTRKMVTERINKRCAGPKKEQGNGQLALPGFEREHLQDYYMVERDGEEIGVCVIDMADAELEAKAKHHEAISATNAAHAREIRRFVAWRKENVARAAARAAE